MQIPRRFTVEGQDPYRLAQINLRATDTSRIVNPNGSVVFEMTNIHVPWNNGRRSPSTSWHKNIFGRLGIPTSIETDRRGRRSRMVAPQRTRRCEDFHNSENPIHVRSSIAWRVAGPIGVGRVATSQAKPTPAPSTMKSASMLANQMAAPNSPQWFNTGLHWAYGIEGPATRTLLRQSC